MVSVEMNDDIRKFETKLIGPFTKRQTICFVVGIAYSLPVAMLVPTSLTNKIFIGLILAIPALICGYAKMDGMYMESLFFRVIYLLFLTPSKRKYVTVNSFREMLKGKEKKRETARLAKMSKSQQKAYHKRKSSLPRYSKKKALKIYR